MLNKDLNILIVEDEVISTEYLRDILESLGFENIWAVANMNDALNVVKERTINLAFMDINIEGSTDGITCAKILNEYCSLPIIFTTAYGDSSTIVEASKTNVFGYLIKPFEANDVESTLLVSLKIIEDSISNANTVKKVKSISLDLGLSQKFNSTRKTFYINNTAIDLTKNELKVLSFLCKNLNQNVSYEILREHIWGNKDISNSTIRDTLSRLKRKAPNLNIQNIINFGYILKKNI